MRLLVVGAGSTGGYFGGRLVQARRDVTFLVRPGRAAQLKKRGLRILSPQGDVTVQPQLLTAAELRSSFDTILLTVKGFALKAAMEDIAPGVGPNTVVLPVLNGMWHVEALQRRFGENAVGGCTCRCATMLDAEGRIVQLTKLHDLAFSELNDQVSSRMRALDTFMANAGFDARLSPVIAREMWEKWLLLACLGAITCLMRGNVGQIAATPGGREFVLQVVDEAIAIISAVGVAPSKAVIEQTRALLTKEQSTQTSSMYRDLEQGHALEADEIIGDLVRRGHEAGVAAPCLAAT